MNRLRYNKGYYNYFIGGLSMTDKGTTDKIKGKAKEVAGDVTGDDKQKAEGFLDQAIGKVKEVASDAKEKVEDVVEDVKEKLDK